jgi:hypothetical protein
LSNRFVIITVGCGVGYAAYHQFAKPGDGEIVAKTQDNTQQVRKQFFMTMRSQKQLVWGCILFWCLQFYSSCSGVFQMRKFFYFHVDSDLPIVA